MKLRMVPGQCDVDSLRAVRLKLAKGPCHRTTVIEGFMLSVYSYGIASWLPGKSKNPARVKCHVGPRPRAYPFARYAGTRLVPTEAGKRELRFLADKKRFIDPPITWRNNNSLRRGRIKRNSDHRPNHLVVSLDKEVENSSQVSKDPQDCACLSRHQNIFRSAAFWEAFSEFRVLRPGLPQRCLFQRLPTFPLNFEVLASS